MKGISGVSRAFSAIGNALKGAVGRSIMASAQQEVAKVKKSRGKGRNKTSPSRHRVAMDKRAAVKARNRARSKR